MNAEKESAPVPRVARSSLFEQQWLALVYLLLLFLALVWPIVLEGHVAVPVDNRLSFHLAPRDSEFPQLPRLGDVNDFFVPKLYLHFEGNYSRWNSTWNPHITLGKPTSHFGGYSKAYPLTYLLSFFSHDPYRLHAWLGTVTVGLLTLFSFLFLRAWGLHPAAALLGAAGIGLNTRSAYWLGFAQFVSWATWSVGILWLSVSWTRRRRPVTWLGLVFFSYCLIIGARHQATIRVAYLVIPFVLATAMRPRDARWKNVTGLTLAVILALALAFPLLHDLIDVLGSSTRFRSDSSEFLAEHWTALSLRSATSLWNAFAFGNPADESYPLPTAALNFTPFCSALLVLAFVTPVARRSRLLLGVFAVFLALSTWKSFYFFAMHNLGFGFSRSNPVGGLYLPVMLMVALVVDSLLADRDCSRIPASRSLLAMLAVTGLGVWGVVASSATTRVHWGYFSIGLATSAAAMIFVFLRRPWIIYVVTGVQVVLFAAPALVHRPLHEVARTSPLIDSLREATPDGHRFAKFGEAGRLLTSNKEVLVGLSSIHGYDSVSSVKYGRLTRRLSRRGVVTLGRHFSSLDDESKLVGDAFSFTGVSAILSDRELPLDGWSVVPVPPDALLYVASDPFPLVAVVADFERAGDEATVAGLEPLSTEAGAATVVEHRDDLWRIATEPRAEESLLFISTQYHADWRAESTGIGLRTVRINDFFLGVLLPPSTSEVSVSFEPLARFAWIPLLFFAVAFPLVGVYRTFHQARQG